MFAHAAVAVLLLVSWPNLVEWHTYQGEQVCRNTGLIERKYAGTIRPNILEYEKIRGVMEFTPVRKLISDTSDNRGNCVCATSANPSPFCLKSSYITSSDTLTVSLLDNGIREQSKSIPRIFRVLTGFSDCILRAVRHHIDVETYKQVLRWRMPHIFQFECKRHRQRTVWVIRNGAINRSVSGINPWAIFGLRLGQLVAVDRPLQISNADEGNRQRNLNPVRNLQIEEGFFRAPLPDWPPFGKREKLALGWFVGTLGLWLSVAFLAHQFESIALGLFAVILLMTAIWGVYAIGAGVVNV